MKNRITRNRLIIAPAIVVLAAAGVLYSAGWLQTAKAQRGDGGVRQVFTGVLGIVPGQRLRIIVGNTEESAGNRFVYVYYTVSNPSGIPLYESERIQVPPREFRFSDVSPEDLNTEGEPETGRVQVMVTVTLEVPAGSNPADFPASLELVNDLTGSTILMSTTLVWKLRNSNTPG